MAGSSDTTSFADQSASVMILNMKPHQNLTLDLYLSRYPEALRSMIECLRFSPLAQALTMVESIPLVHLSKAYSTANYSQAEGIITFEVASHKTSISKACFCRRLRFTCTEGLVDPDSISSSALIEMFYQMGYIGDISLLSKFRNPNLPSMWNGLFTLLFKSLSERVAGDDSASKLFCTLIYGLYTGLNLDYGDILWTQLVQSTVLNTRHSEISCAQFWSVIVKRALTHFQVPLIEDTFK